MFCPRCVKVELEEVTKQDVLIDVCTQCRGVWLDRGELEKILAAGRTARRDYDEAYGEGHRHPEKYHEKPHGHYDHDQYKYKKHHKKKSFFDVIENIFD
ncbi:MAG: zf-TFIIB domain-containing protein [Bacillota bacterium]